MNHSSRFSTSTNPRLRVKYSGTDDTVPMLQYRFHLSISAEEFLDYYRGTVRHVIAKDTTGKTVQFPASLLQKHVMPEGIHGDFLLTCDENHKVVSLQRI